MPFFVVALKNKKELSTNIVNSNKIKVDNQRLTIYNDNQNRKTIK